jgi:hypothetical protein
MYGWGVQVREMIGLYTESKCWRCLSETVPDEDELGLCDLCITDRASYPMHRVDVRRTGRRASARRVS